MLSLARPRARNSCRGAFDNVSLETGEEGKHFASLRGRHRKFLQGCGDMTHKDLPVTRTDAQAFVGGRHIAARVEDRAPCGLTHIVDHQLAISSETVLAVAFP